MPVPSANMRVPLLLGMLAAVTAAGIAGVIFVRRRYFAVTVEGNSMSPAFKPGDRVLMRRGTRGLAPGRLVVVARPDAIAGWDGEAVLDTDLSVAGRFVKRVAAVGGQRYPEAMRRTGQVPHGHVIVLGDNPQSVDSKQFGPCPVGQILGVSRG